MRPLTRTVLPLLLPLFLAACGAPDFNATRFAGTASAHATQVQPPPLRFPARIGVARFVSGRLSVAPIAEDMLFAENTPPLGDFVTLGPLETRMAGLRYLRPGTDGFRDFAASRNLTYLLVIDLDPGRNTGEALFIDVASGYPFASFEVAAPGRGIRTFWGNPVKPGPRRDRATLKIAEHMVPGMKEMLTGLAARAR